MLKTISSPFAAAAANGGGKLDPGKYNYLPRMKKAGAVFKKPPARLLSAPEDMA